MLNFPVLGFPCITEKTPRRIAINTIQMIWGHCRLNVVMHRTVPRARELR